ncbi:DsbA family protein [archaeon]|nr:DsbA family protein [archaeon]
MAKYYLLAIPIVIGIITGTVMAYHPESESNALTATKLIENGSPIMGDPRAPITVLEWGDYQCTYCYKFHQNTLNAIDDDFIKTGKVKLVFKDYPLNGPESVLAAEASHCAQDQEKYWEYHHELYKNWGGERTGWITRESLNQFANTINLNIDDFNTCLDEHKYNDKVISMHEFGQEIGIDATPSFLVFNEQKVIKIRGNQPLEVFLKTFDGM